MTATTDTAPATTGTWIESDVQLAHNIASALRNMAAMIATHPEVAPLWAGMFRNLILPVADPETAMPVLMGAAPAGGAVVSQATLGGLEMAFGPAVQVWLVTGAEPLEEVAVQDVPQPDEPEAPVESDADAETVPGVAA